MYKLTKEHEDHAQHIVDMISSLTYSKYVKGATEHESKLWEYPVMSLLYEMRNEAIDQFVYIQTAIDLMEKQDFNSDMSLDEYKQSKM